MIGFLQSIIHSVGEYASNLSQTQFIMLSALVLLVGAFCLRGFGERI